MPIEVGIWKLNDGKPGGKPQRVELAALDLESRLEDALVADLALLDPDLLLISRQVITEHGGRIDLLAIDAEGQLVIAELKRDKTPRDIVAQTLDYASWVQNLSRDRISELYERFHDGQSLEAGFEERFGCPLPEEINLSHRLVIVAASIDPATERIINYLAENFAVPLNAAFFQYFRDGVSEYLARYWLLDPAVVEARNERSRDRRVPLPWNGEDFYVNFGDNTADGEGVHRSWEDARRYGFVSAGGAPRFARAMARLPLGKRVFAYIPKHGYVGVGTVIEEARPATEVEVEVGGKRVPLLKAPLIAAKMVENAANPETCDHVVRVKWDHAVPKAEAFWETGLFAKPNAVCKLRSRETLEKLAERFPVEE